MIQVLDTHRLQYKNATIIGFSDVAKTNRIFFYNATDPERVVDETDNIGTEVYTNENGYLCYGTNRQPVTCLVVRESAIIQVSLNDGSNRSIEFIVRGTGDLLTTEDIHSLKYHDGPGNVKTWSALFADGELPDYITRNELDLSAMWAEQTYTLNDNDDTIVMSVWTKIIVIPSTVTASVLTISTEAARAGQVVIIKCEKNVTLSNVRSLSAGTYLMTVVDGNVAITDLRYDSGSVIENVVADGSLRISHSGIFNVTDGASAIMIDAGVVAIMINSTDNTILVTTTDGAAQQLQSHSFLTVGYDDGNTRRNRFKKVTVIPTFASGNDYIVNMSMWNVYLGDILNGTVHVVIDDSAVAVSRAYANYHIKFGTDLLPVNVELGLGVSILNGHALNVRLLINELKVFDGVAGETERMPLALGKYIVDDGRAKMYRLKYDEIGTVQE